MDMSEIMEIGKPAYKKCQQLLRKIKKDYELEIASKDLVRIISLNIGADQRTIDSYIDYLIRFGILQSKGNGVFKILK